MFEKLIEKKKIFNSKQIKLKNDDDNDSDCNDEKEEEDEEDDEDEDDEEIISKNSNENDEEDELETINAYLDLVKNIKEDIAMNGACVVDLNHKRTESSSSHNSLELFIDKNLINKKICKDLYDWSLAHIQKSIGTVGYLLLIIFFLNF